MSAAPLLREFISTPGSFVGLTVEQYDRMMDAGILGEDPSVELLDGFLVRDYLTGADFTRKDILSPRPFHDLLCARVDHAHTPQA